MYIHFHIYGLLTFRKCQFTSSKLIFSIIQNIVEYNLSTEQLGQFHYYAASYKIKLLECNFISNNQIGFNVHRVWREILLQQCNFNKSHVVLVVGNKTLEHCKVISAVIYQIENSTFEWSYIRVFAHSENSFAILKFSHVFLDGSYLIQFDTGGYVSFHLDNCIFINIESLAIISFQAIYMNISDCLFKLIESPYCELDGCVIHTVGRSFGSDMAKKLFFPTCTSSFWWFCLKIEIHNTHFIGTPEKHKFIIKTTYIHLTLNKSKFNTRNPNRFFTGRALFESVFPYKIVVIETTFDASESFTKNNIHIVVIKKLQDMKFFNTHILCPKIFRAVDVLNSKNGYSYIVSCKVACKIDEYTYDGGSIIINGTLHSYTNTNSLASTITEPSCHACPVGGKCDGNIKSLPNYWGYKNGSDHVTMIRCPDGYCCQNDHTCQGISSCQKGRTGTLCGRCIENLTESLISPKCIDSSKCYTELVLIMYFLSSLSYAVGILTIDSIKRKVLELFKMLYKLIRKKSLKKGQK